MSPIASRLDEIRARINGACERSCRPPSSVTLVAVSKTFGVDAIREAYEHGQLDFGESRWQELESKKNHLPEDIRWHFLGKLQSNKVRRIAAETSLIHSLDSESQLREIAKCDHSVRGLIEVNLGGEEQKGGIEEHQLGAWIKQCRQLPNLSVEGLMTIGPLQATDDENRLMFRRLAMLCRQFEFSVCSMGMSNDFELAIEEGATHVRVGSAIFGTR